MPHFLTAAGADRIRCKGKRAPKTGAPFPPRNQAFPPMVSLRPSRRKCCCQGGLRWRTSPLVPAFRGGENLLVLRLDPMMWKNVGRSLFVFSGSPAGSSTTRILTAGMKTLIIPPDYSGIKIPEKPKLKFFEKVPNVQKATRQPKNLRDICGPSLEATEFTEGQYGIMALDGGYLRWEHMEVMRLTINRHLNPKTMFAVWRIPAPYKPVTRKGLGHRMGGGKGAISFYVTAVKSGRLLVEVGGHCEFSQVEFFLNQVIKKLPFKAKAVSRKSLQEMRETEEERRRNNQNPWTFERIVKANMLGVRKYLSPYDLPLKGCYWGRFYLPDRI